MEVDRGYEGVRGSPGLVPVAELVQVRRHLAQVLEGVNDDVVDGVAPGQHVCPRAQRLPLVGSAQPPCLQDVLISRRQSDTDQ